jgi:glucosamine-6-phosphate deaminase
VRITVCRNAEAASAAVARRLAAAVRRAPSLVLGLPTGQTPVRLYARLVARVEAGALDLSRVRTFNLDEFLGVAPNDPGSYRAFMERHVFGPAGVPRGRTHVLDGRARDVEAECERFEAAIEAAGGIDLQLVGLGLNGHIGFNEPGPHLVANTHRVRLAPATRRANAALFGGDVRKVPKEALSMGIGTILRARRVIMLATGASKARVVRRLVEGPVTTWLPASFLQLHPHAEVVLDEAAAGKLSALEE